MGKKKVIGLVLNNFKNDSRVLKISNSLRNRNYSVKIIAMHDRDTLVHEAVNGIEVERLIIQSRRLPKLLIFHIIMYIEFCVKSIKRSVDANVIHCNDLNTLIIGVLSKILNKKIRIVYDCHEYETEINGLSGVRKIISKFMERVLIGWADSILTVSDSIANEYSKIYSIPKPHLVLNCPSFVEQVKCDLFRERFGIRSDQLIFLYQGGLSKGRGIEILLDAFAQRPDDRCVMVCMGYGPLESTVKAFAQKNSNIFFHPAVDQKVLLDHTSSADFGILFYEDTCLNHRYCSPNKIFEYLMAGIPVLTSNLFEMRRLVETESVGLVAESNDVHGFRLALERALDLDTEAILKNVRRVRQRYCWEEQEKVLGDVYVKL